LNIFKFLNINFENIFQSLTKKNWVVDPFNADVPEITGLTTTQENQLINISSNSNLKRIFKEFSLLSFWLSLRQHYLEISEAGIRCFF